MRRQSLVVAGGAAALVAMIAGCGDGGQNGGVSTVEVDGSSTVYPVMEAMAEEFQNEFRGQYRVTVGVSGTGGGFKKFCRGETDISDASRPISESERGKCKDNGIKYVEVPVALDALTVAVHPENDWVSCMSVDELKSIWEPAAQNELTNWNQVRDDFPDRPLALYGPGTDSGTYDYFTEAIVGEAHSSRGDFTASEDDNVLVQGISSDRNSLGFFGYAYYEENQDRLKAIEIEHPETGECVAPSIGAAKNGTYQPLSRPLFVYVNTESLDNNEAVSRFVEFSFNAEVAGELTREIGYVPLPDEAYEMASENLDQRVTGTAFAQGAEVGISIEDLLQADRTD